MFLLFKKKIKLRYVKFRIEKIEAQFCTLKDCLMNLYILRNFRRYFSLLKLIKKLRQIAPAAVATHDDLSHTADIIIAIHSIAKIWRLYHISNNWRYKIHRHELLPLLV